MGFYSTALNGGQKELNAHVPFLYLQHVSLRCRCGVKWVNVFLNSLVFHLSAAFFLNHDVCVVEVVNILSSLLMQLSVSFAVWLSETLSQQMSVGQL